MEYNITRDLSKEEIEKLCLRSLNKTNKTYYNFGKCTIESRKIDKVTGSFEGIFISTEEHWEDFTIQITRDFIIFVVSDINDSNFETFEKLFQELSCKFGFGQNPYFILLYGLYNCNQVSLDYYKKLLNKSDYYRVELLSRQELNNINLKISENHVFRT